MRACASVLEDFQVVASRDFVDPVEVAGMPGIMHGHNDPGIRRDFALQVGRVHGQRVGGTVHKNRTRAKMDHHCDRGGKGHGRHQYVIPGTDSHRFQRKTQGGGRRCDGNGVGCADEGREVRFKLLDPRSGCQPIRTQRFADRLDFFIPDAVTKIRDLSPGLRFVCGASFLAIALTVVTTGTTRYFRSARNRILCEPANIEVTSVAGGVLAKRVILQLPPEIENRRASLTVGVNAKIGTDLAAIDTVAPAAVVFAFFRGSRTISRFTPQSCRSTAATSVARSETRTFRPKQVVGTALHACRRNLERSEIGFDGVIDMQ